MPGTTAHPAGADAVTAGVDAVTAGVDAVTAGRAAGPRRRPLALAFWLAQLGGWGLLATLLTALAATMKRPGQTLGAIVVEYTILSATGLAVTTLLWLVMRRAIDRGMARIVLAALLGALAAALLWGLANDALRGVVLGRVLPQAPSAQTIWGLFLLFLLVMAWQAIVLSGHLTRRAREARERALASAAATSEARLLALQHQLDPHFLFNAINAIVGLIGEDAERAQRVLTRLAELLRGSLGVEPTWALRREIALVAHYLEIQQVRFDTDLRVEVHVVDAACERQVPAFALQLLVENAIKHGLRTSAMPLTVRIYAELDAGQLRLRVSNSGELEADPVPGGGLGLTNLRERLHHLYPGAHAFRLYARDGWVHAELRLGDADAPASEAAPAAGAAPRQKGPR